MNMAKNVHVGVFFKKLLGIDGQPTGEKEIFLPRTLSNLVYRQDGSTVEQALSESNVPTFANWAAYQAALSAGTVSPNSLVIIENEI